MPSFKNRNFRHLALVGLQLEFRPKNSRDFKAGPCKLLGKSEVSGVESTADNTVFRLVHTFICILKETRKNAEFISRYFTADHLTLEKSVLN
jgi:hypothetical protein